MAIKYIVNKEKRTVEAILQNTENDAKHIFEKMQKRFDPAYKMTTVFVENANEKWLMSTSYRGTAKCFEDDVWDVKTGMDIARQRCINKYRVALHKKLDYIRWSYFGMYHDMNAFVQKAGRINHGTDILEKKINSKGDFC